MIILSVFVDPLRIILIAAVISSSCGCIYFITTVLIAYFLLHKQNLKKRGKLELRAFITSLDTFSSLQFVALQPVSFGKQIHKVHPRWENGPGTFPVFP